LTESKEELIPKKKGLIVFVEGDTEKEFYKKLMEHLKGKCPGQKYPFDHVKRENAKGICNFKAGIVRKFKNLKNQILKDENNKYESKRQKGIDKFDFYVVLAYDTDVFELDNKPPINWSEVEMALYNAGAKEVIHIKARQCIEDWFLSDLKGVLKFLKLSASTKLKGSNGLKRLEYAFKKANRVYIKGKAARGFIEALDIELIAREHSSELKPLCNILQIKS